MILAVRPQAADLQHAVLRAGHGDGVDLIAPAGEAEVLAGKGPRLAVGEAAFFDDRGAFLRQKPQSRAVNGLVVDLHPAAHGAQNLHVLIRQRAVGLRAEVQQEPSVLADHVDQIPQNLPRLLVVGPFGIAPAVPHHRGVGLPQEGLGLSKLAPLDVGHAAAEGECVHLVVDDPAAPALRPVVIIGQKAKHVGLGRLLNDPPVEIHDARVIPIHDLTAAQQPIRQEFVVRRALRVRVEMHGRFRLGGPVQVAGLRVPHVAVECPAMAHEPPVLNAVAGRADGHARLFGFLQQVAQHIPVRAHFKSVPAGQLRAVHLEAVVMLSHGNNVLRPGLLEQLHPFRRVKLFHGQLGNEALVTMFPMVAVMLQMVFVLRAALNVHIPGIPVMIGRNGKRAPVQKNAQPFFPIPRGQGAGCDGFPLGLVRPLLDHPVDLAKIAFAVHAVDPPCRPNAAPFV